MTAKRFTTIKKDDLFYVANDKFGVVLVDKEESLMVMSMCNDMIEYLNKLSDENEQLKKQLESEHQQLENAILLERTRMGKNCLKQFREAIQ